jgi:hypothetical protein
MTEEQNKLAELIALSEKATQGKWILHQQPNYCAINAEKQGSLGGDLGVARSNGAKRNIADLDFIISLVNWFRANQASLREPATEAVLEPVCLAGNLLCPHPLTCAGEVRCFTAPIQVRDYVLKLEHALKGKGASQGAVTTRCAVSFEHPPHDYCDGNPGAKFLPEIAAPEPSGEFVRMRRDTLIRIHNECHDVPMFQAAVWNLLAASPDEQKGGREEVIEIDEDGKVSRPLPKGIREP